MKKKEYTEQQKVEFVALAQEIGIGRAIRELKYPSWPTGLAWCNARNVKPATDQTMAQMKSYHTFYETEDAILVAETVIGRVAQMASEDDLDADGVKKVSEALQKSVNAWLLLKGKAINISQSHSVDSVDLEVQELMNQFRAKESSRDLEPRSTTEK